MQNLGANWKMILQAMQFKTATSWFRDPGEASENDVTAKEAADYFGFTNDAFSENIGYSKYFMHARELNGQVTPGTSSKQKYVSKINLEKSPFARRVQNFFQDLGLPIHRGSQTQEYKDEDELWGIFGNDHDYPFIQSGKVFENSEGKEFLYWSTDLFLHSKNISELAVDIWLLRIPSMLEAMLYLSEIPIQESMLKMDRSSSSAFDQVPKQFIPKPVINYTEGGFALIPKASPGGDNLKAFPTPTTISVGYDISSDLNNEDLEVVLTTVVNSLITLSSLSIDAYESVDQKPETGVPDLFEILGLTEKILYEGNLHNAVGNRGLIVPACSDLALLEKIFR